MSVADSDYCDLPVVMSKWKHRVRKGYRLGKAFTLHMSSFCSLRRRTRGRIMAIKPRMKIICMRAQDTRTRKQGLFAVQNSIRTGKGSPSENRPIELCLEWFSSRPEYKKPFDVLAKGLLSGDWLPGQDSNLRPAGYKDSQSFERAWTISSPACVTGEGVGRW